MKKQIKSNWQHIPFAAIVSLILFAANLTAFAQTSYRVKDRIEVQYGYNAWYKAEILEIKDGSYKVRYDGYSSSSDEWVKPYRMRHIGNKSPTDNEAENQPGENPQGTYKVGEQIEVQYENAWYRANVVEVKDGSYRIRFEDDNTFSEQLVKPGRMRRIGGAPPTANQTNDTTVKPTNDTAVKPTNAKFKPGDRVECDISEIGVWSAGTVMHYTPLDAIGGRNIEYYRVRIDKLVEDGATLSLLSGIKCWAIRPLNDGKGTKPSSVKYKVGDRVQALNYAGGWLPGKIIKVLEREFYTVRFDDHEDKHNESVDAVRLKPVGKAKAAVAEPDKPTKPKSPTPKMAGGLPVLPGTSWWIDWGKKGGSNAQTFLFSKSGKFEVVPGRLFTGDVPVYAGTYKAIGGSLTTRNEDGTADNYKMTWKGDALELFDGKMTMTLRYNGETQWK